MIDFIVRPEGPPVIGSDRRSAIFARSGGSAANQAVWLAHFGLNVSFIGRVGSSDHAAQVAAFEQCGVEPWLSSDEERETGRLIALVDPRANAASLPTGAPMTA